MPTMTVPSAAMCRLRREGLEISRKKAALAPTGGAAANKPSPPPPNTFVLALPAPLPPRPNTAAHTTTSRQPAPRRAAGGGGALLERARPAVPPSAIPRSRHATAAAAAAPAEAITSDLVGKGAQVRVRTRVGTARGTGQPIVLWLRAVVDSSAADEDDGCLRVTYSCDINGKLPRVARVAPSDVRLHDVVPRAGDAAASFAGYSSAVTSDRSARPPPKQSKAAPPRPRPRPAVAGKKLQLLRKFEEEMKSRSNGE
ncbi:unnamed protein product [Urochloa decumbens]|uniref:Uncharacterized protein n=1 Tax=Urochloa decumbens TaxID=240449 RepID=A0ABC9ESN4_9POAL